MSKESKEEKTVQLMESAVIALENIASILVQISYHMGADLPVKAVMPVSEDKLSVPAPEIEVNTAEPAETEPAETGPAKAEEAPVQEPVKEEQETVLELTLEDLRQACITASQHNNEAKNTIRSILTGKYGVKNISGLDSTDYYAFWKEIQSL